MQYVEADEMLAIIMEPGSSRITVEQHVRRVALVYEDRSRRSPSHIRYCAAKDFIIGANFETMPVRTDVLAVKENDGN